ncbi:MAG: right-handed parallel beta-helix repeat-containing protein [Methanophagales archaeon]|nr:right-handed parallel beta-helix repeat-containing protein [Methanophagales archaeon]
MDKKYGILIICAAILFLSVVGTASAKIWYVDDDLHEFPYADFTKIQDAVNIASPRDTIIVYNGTYYENIDIDKRLNLTGIGMPLIIGGGSGPAIDIQEGADNCMLYGFKITSIITFIIGISYSGISISSNNNIIKDNEIFDNYFGIFTHYPANNNTLINNIISNNYNYGVSIWFGNNNILKNNSIFYNYNANKWGTFANNSIFGGGVWLLHSSNNTLAGNNVSNNNHSGIFLDNARNSIIINNVVCSNTWGLVGWYNNSNIIINRNIFSNNSEEGIFIYANNNDSYSISNNKINFNKEGIDYWGSKNIDIINNTIKGNSNSGIFIRSLNGKNKIKNNNLTYNDCGIQLYLCNYTNITSNTIDTNEIGIELFSCYNNSIIDNTISSNDDQGIVLRSSCYNIINRNNILDNLHGIRLSYVRIVDPYYKVLHSTGNKIYHNNFINNTNTILSEDSANIWNSTSKITYIYNGTTYENYLGNYWSDYKERYPDAEEIDECGIWDMPYGIDGDKDNYPLMMCFENYITPTPANVVIWYAHYDAAGNDHYNLNDEYIVLKNIGGTSINLEGWVMQDKENRTYIFPCFELLSGATVTIRTGSGTNTATDLYWGSKRAIWNNDGDTVYLYDPNNNLVATKSW